MGKDVATNESGGTDDKEFHREPSLSPLRELLPQPVQIGPHSDGI